MSEDATKYQSDIVTTTNIICRPGTKFLRELAKDEHWIIHPSGNGIVVVHPDRPMVWVRIDDDGNVVEDVVRFVPTS